MEPKKVFEDTMCRVDRLLRLYGLLCDKRSRSVRSDWAENFRKLMHWPRTEEFQRVDGEHTILILREAAHLDRSHFCANELGEILRAALVFALSALDRFCHELILPKAMEMLRRSSSKWPSGFKNLTLPLADIKSAIERAKKRRGKGGRIRTRPMTIIRRSLQDHFHRSLTLQKPDAIAQAFSMVGVESLWTECGKEMKEKPEDIKKRLNHIVDRRNQIVHEGDLVRKRKTRKVTFNPINAKKVKDDVEWIRRLANAINAVVNKE